MSALEDGVLFDVVNRDDNVEKSIVNEMDVIKCEDEKVTKLGRPKARTRRIKPDPLDVVRRAVASVTEDPSVTATLLDVRSMSFAVRECVYTMAKAKTSDTRRVIVTFGVGRFQEWRQMFPGNHSYIAIGPEIDTSDMSHLMYQHGLVVASRIAYCRPRADRDGGYPRAYRLSSGSRSVV